MSSLDDDGGLSSDIIAVEEDFEGVTQQSLWIGVRPVYHGNERGEVMVQISYQQQHMAGTLAGPVWLSPETWRELNRAVEWRLRRRESKWKQFWYMFKP